MLNTRIKSFKSIAYFNNKFYFINEKDFLNKWSVLFFYPFSYSFICPNELKEISLKKKEFEDINSEIYSISTDSHYVHKNWSEKDLKIKNLIFISDFNHKISKDLNILNKKNGNCLRSTIIIDPNLLIKSIEIYDNDIGRSIEEIIKKVKMLKFINKNENVLCPYSWNFTGKSIKIIN